MIFKLDDFISRLDSEIHKINAFKRVLPLWMLLNNDDFICWCDLSSNGIVYMMIMMMSLRTMFECLEKW
ncbi:hypothetical protein Hanom_Chr06g00523941 [Helianthus anomalus]